MASQRRPYTAAEWEAKKDVILKMKSDGKDYNTIIKELEKRFPDFRPTLPMLKKRMKEWKVVSNHREPDIAEAVKIAAQRQKINKKTAFKIGDKVVTQEEINRYLMRKGVRNHKIWAANISKPPANTIQPYTPPPTPPPGGKISPEPSTSSESSGSRSGSPGSSTTRWPSTSTDPSSTSEDDDDAEPIERLSANEVERGRFLAAQNAFVETYFNDHIYHRIEGPHESQMLTKSIFYTNDYCQRLFASEWSIPGLAPINGSDPLNDFTNGMWKGWNFLFDDNPDAFMHFSQGFVALEQLVKNHDRRFLPELLEMLLNLQLEPSVPILQKLLQQLYDLYDVKEMKNDILFQVIESLLTLSKEDRLEVVEKLMNNVSFHFGRELGVNHPETKSIQKALTRSVYRKHPVSKAINDLQKRLATDGYFISQGYLQHTMDLYDKCNVCIELALCYRSQKNIKAVEEWITFAMELADQLESLFHRTDMRVRCHRVLTYVKRKKDDWQGAYNHWQAAVAESAAGLGPTDSLTVLVESERADFVERARKLGIALVDEEVVFEEPPVVVIPVLVEQDYFESGTETEVSFVTTSSSGASVSTLEEALQYVV